HLRIGRGHRHQIVDLPAHRVQLLESGIDLPGDLTFEVEWVEVYESLAHLPDVGLGLLGRGADGHERQPTQVGLDRDARARPGKKVVVDFDSLETRIFQLVLESLEQLLAEHLQTGYIAHIGDRGRRLVGRLDGVVTEVRCPHRGHDGDQHDEENGSPSMAQNSERSTSHQILAFSESSRVTVSKPSHSWVARSRSPSRTPTMSCSSARRSSRATKSYIVTGPGEGGRVRLTRGWS